MGGVTINPNDNGSFKTMEEDIYFKTNLPILTLFVVVVSFIPAHCGRKALIGTVKDGRDPNVSKEVTGKRTAHFAFYRQRIE